MNTFILIFILWILPAIILFLMLRKDFKANPHMEPEFCHLFVTLCPVINLVFLITSYKNFLKFMFGR